MCVCVFIVGMFSVFVSRCMLIFQYLSIYVCFVMFLPVSGKFKKLGIVSSLSINERGRGF